MICFACGESDTEVFGSSGNSVCTKCGTVLEENAIVSEISFGETSGGAAMVQGSYVGADQTRARAPAGYRQKGGGTESREQTIANGRRRIQTLALGLNIPDRLSDTAQRYFNLAVNMKFVQGRRTQYVVAAVLYCACRMDKTSHMLIDFSDILEINVFVLGSTYLKLVKELNLQLPSVDPSLYISRFAALLEFGEETQKVAADATRLVSRMSRDWMNTGRRPAGVCGACLLLAARMNNFRRSVTEVVQVVKIADVTLRKRLAEFKDTPSGKLTVSDFRTLWLDEVADPPAFAKNQKIERLARERDEEVKRLNRAESGVNSDGEEDDDQTPGEKEAFEELAAGKEPGSGAVEEGEEDEEDSIMAPPPIPSAKALGKRKAKRNRDATEDNDSADEGLGDEHLELDEAIANEVGATLDSETGKILVTELDMAEKRRITTASSMTNLNSMTDLNTSERLDDLDEDELDMFILNETEVAAKSRLWMEFNKQYLQELADKQTGPDGELKPAVARRIRKKHKPRDSTNAAGTNAADATKQMLTKKRFSKKINYAAIDNLFGTPSKKKARSDGEEASGDDDEEDGESFMVGMNSTPDVTPGTPIHIPAPNWKNPSRSGTPVRSNSRANSIVPEVVAPAEEEGEEEYAAAPVEEEEEEQEEWQRMLTQGKGGEEEEDDGYGEDAGY